jgi:hypothetical protein
MSYLLRTTMIEADRLKPDALRGCLEVCRRCEDLVGAVMGLSNKEPSELYLVIGPHLRHCLDHFTNLLRGLPAGEVDYDARDRDARVEQRPEVFQKLLEDTIAQLEATDGDDLQRPIRVLQQSASEHPSQPVKSNLERELVFLSSHTIHHLALMVHLAKAHGVAMPEELGVAFSTAAYHADLEGSAG